MCCCIIIVLLHFFNYSYSLSSEGVRFKQLSIMDSKAHFLYMYYSYHLFHQEENKEEKVADVTSAIVHNINVRCNCSFTSNSLLDGEFYCFDMDSISVTYRGRLRGLAKVNSSNLTAYVAAWVATGGTILLHNIIFHLDSRCMGEVVIKDLLSPECAPTIVEGSVPDGPLSGGEIGAATVVSLVTAVIGLVGVALGIIFKDKIQERLCNLR